MEVYLNGEDIDVWEVVNLLSRDEAIEVMEHIKSTLSSYYSYGDETIQGREFKKACEKLINHRDMLPKDVEEKIIEVAKNYTPYY